MASYAVTGRIERVQPRLARHDDARTPSRGPAVEEATAEAIDLGRTTSEWWERFRERWAQTTFYLFDPESWR